jgi:hypothetical protein
MPVGTGFVVMLDQAGNEVARALSSRDGRFTLRAPGGGEFRLKSERIGYSAFLSSPLRLAESETVDDFTLRVAALPVRLATVKVLGRDRCRTNPEEGEGTVLIWEEIRKALASAAWSGEQEFFFYRKYSYQRELNAGRNRIIEERGTSAAGVSDPPYRSVPAERLAREGYIVDRLDGTWYYVPDAYVLLDPGFLGTHCFHVVRDTRNRPGWVGLAFEPMRDREQADVRGTLWLDETTSELRTLEVQHTRIPDGLDDDRVGGTVDFLMLPSGAWIVRQWQIRTPIVTITEDSRRLQRRRASAQGFRDIGGEIYEVSRGASSIVFEAPMATISGTVFDSTKGHPLEGAFVSVAGTDFTSLVGRDGRYRLEVPLEGEYSVSLAHPWLDSIAVPPQSETLRLVRDSTHEVSFAVPHANSVLRDLCGGSMRIPQSRVVIGVVRAVSTGRPVDGARISASWQSIAESGRGYTVRSLSEETRTDGDGFYAMCYVPAGRPVTLWAEKDEEVSREASIIFPYEPGGNLLMAWGRRPGQPYEHAYPAPERVWKLDLMTGAPLPSEVAAGSSPALSGVVTDRGAGVPIDSTSVVLNGRDTTVTRGDGTFDLLDVGWVHGTNRVEFHRPGYESIAWEFWLEEDDTGVSLSVRMDPSAVELEEVEVGGERLAVPAKLVGFYQRRERGRGHFMGPEELERISALNVIDVIRRAPGVSVLRPDPGVVGVNEQLQFSRASVICRSMMQQPLVYVDGSMFDVEAMLSLEVANLAAVEVYNGASETPPRFNRTGSGCGLILLWTR